MTKNKRIHFLQLFHSERRRERLQGGKEKEGGGKKANSSDTNSGPKKGEEQAQHCQAGGEKSKLERGKKRGKKTARRGKEPESLRPDWRGEKKVLTAETKEEDRG